MQCTAVGAAEGRGHAHLAVEHLAQALSALVDVLRVQAPADQLHELVGEHGDEQVPIGARFLVVKDRAAVPAPI